jgi:SET domain-containing protein
MCVEFAKQRRRGKLNLRDSSWQAPGNCYPARMLLIQTGVQPSSIHGMGLFAVEFVPRGTPVWRFQPGFDQAFGADAFPGLPENVRRHLRWFAYLDAATRNWILSGDHACFMNHSTTPNTGVGATEFPSLEGLGVSSQSKDALPPVTTIALQDIGPGEELTCDYFAFDVEAGAKLS